MEEAVLSSASILPVLSEDAADMGEGLRLPFFGEHAQEGFEECGGFGVNDPAGLAPFEVGKGVAVLIFRPVIDLGGGHAVAEHLDDPAQGHFHGLDTAGGHGVIRPVFKVVAVASLVVHPCGGIAFFLTFLLIGAAGALIIADAGDEFLRAEFGEIVPQSLPENAGFPAMPDDSIAMACDGGEMADEIPYAHGAAPFALVFSIIAYFAEECKMGGYNTNACVFAVMHNNLF